MQKLITLLAAAVLLCAGAYAQQPHNASYPDDPAYKGVAEDMKGSVTKFSFNQSTVYPGTERDIWVYIPKQYDGKKPACLLLGMDGILFGATNVLDYLISSGEMPVTIGIFINPGLIKNADGKVVRYNRSNEYDRCDGKFASFLEKDIIPFVESQKTADGKAVKISAKAEDRAIYGASSGAIASFTVAWFRPDLFSRVYSSVGTYIPFRGGDNYPALIRKTEPKAIRIFLQDGLYDSWNPVFGSWYEENRLMESALDFAGYEMTYKWDRGHHNVAHGSKMFPDAMRWLWKGWPAAVKAGKSLSDCLPAILPAENNGWELVGNADGALFDREPRVLTSPSGTSFTAPRGGDIAAYPGWELLAESVPGTNWIRSYVLGADGGKLYGQDFYYIHRFAVTTEGCPQAEAGQYQEPLRPKGRKPARGMQPEPQPGVAPGYRMAFDVQGWLYVATELGVQVCDHNGRVRAILDLPAGPVSDLKYEGNVLSVIAGGKIWKRQMLNAGFDPATKGETPKSQGQG